MLARLVSFYALQFRLLWQWKPGRRALVRRMVVTFLVAWASLAATIWLLPGITAPDQGRIVLAVLGLALANALFRPVILALLAPVSVVLVGLATLVFQVASLLVVATVAGLGIDGPVTAFVGSWVYAILDTALTALFSIDRDESYWGALVRALAARRRDVIRTDRPGLVIVQIDGVAHPILAHQIRAGRVPTIARWVRGRTMRLDRWTALLPSQTSAAQAGILHGKNDFIPAFRWWDKERQRMIVSNRPADAAEIAARASNGEGLLSADGASIGNLVHGDAARSYITLSTVGRGGGLGESASFYAFFVSPYNYLHTIVLTIGEVLKELVQARRTARRGIEPRHPRGFPYPLARAATNVALRALSTSLVLEEMYRGTPVIYVDYTDYDEVAHFAGPERAEALDALDGVDSTLRSLEKAARDAPRPYRFVLLSDHGQSLGATFRQRYDQTLQELVVELMGGAEAGAAGGDPSEPYGALSAAVTEAASARGATGAMTRATFRTRYRDGQIDLTPRERRRRRRLFGRRPATPAGTPAATSGAHEPPEVVVAPSGNLALVSFPRLPGRVSLETISRTWPGLVPGLAGHAGVGLVLVRSEVHGAIVFGSEGTAYLDEGRIEGEDPLAPYGDAALPSLRRVDAMAACGDLLVISVLDPTTDEVAAFEELIGSHGGLGGPQTQAFILHPSEWALDEPLVGAEAVYRQLRSWLDGIGIDLGTAVAADGVLAASAPADEVAPGVAAAVEPRTS